VLLKDTAHRKDPFPEKIQTLSSYRVYILPQKWASSAFIQIESVTEGLLKASQRMVGNCMWHLEQYLRTIVQQVTSRLPATMSHP